MPQLRSRLLKVHNVDIGDAPEKFLEEFREEIERLPRSKWELARKALFRVFSRFFEDTLDRKRAVAELVLNAFERDEYWVLVQRIDELSAGDIADLAEILELWGLYEIGEIARRARRRLLILGKFEELAWNSESLELQDVHRMLEKNVWIIGDEYELFVSNISMKRIIEEVFRKRYQGDRERLRPDLILAGIAGNHLLLELKRPSHHLTRNDVAQAQGYRDDIHEHLPRTPVEIRVIGGSVDPALAADETFSRYATTFPAVIVSARRRLEWLLEHIEEDDKDGEMLTVTS